MTPKTKHTGTIQSWTDADGKKQWRARITLADGFRQWIPVPVGYSEARARAFAAAMQEQEAKHGNLLAARLERLRKVARAEGTAAVGETADAWFDRYLPTLECGESHRRITRHNWKKWIAPIVGPKSMADLTRSDLEDVRDKLDRALDAKEIRHTTARNVWSTVTGAMKAAYGSRDRTLRVHAAPLTFGILPPKRGASRQRPWLYPAEWSKLAACEAVPLEHRELYAIALYTGLRPGELRALTWADVDLDARQISVSKAYDEATRATKAPKTSAGQRTVPIEPSLLPLLARLKDAAEAPNAAESARDATARAAAALVAPLLTGGEGRTAGIFREHLARAKLTRARLWADNPTEEPVDFRSLRDSYATWLALSDVPEKRIQRRLGHKSAATTDRYIKAAETFDVDAIGLPFPKFPASLLSTELSTETEKPLVPSMLVAPTVGLETKESCDSSVFAGVADAFAAPEGDVSTRLLVEPASVDSSVDSNFEASDLTPTTRSACAPDVVDAALAAAVQAASKAGEWATVAQLARELEARRVAHAGASVVDLATARRRRVVS